MSTSASCPRCGCKTRPADDDTGRAIACTNCEWTNATPSAFDSSQLVAENLAGRRLYRWLFFLVLFVGGLGLLVPFFKNTRATDRRVKSNNNLKQIGLALHLYHKVYGSFPPGYVAAADGTPRHSWRVLILPYLDQQSLYHEYRFDEPWNGPHNGKLVPRMPRVFDNPRLSLPRGQTSYLGASGPGTVFDGAKSANKGMVSDGLNATIGVLECETTSVVWTYPADLAFSPSPAGELMAPPEVSTWVVRAALMLDGSVRSFSYDLHLNNLGRLATIAAGDSFDETLRGHAARKIARSEVTPDAMLTADGQLDEPKESQDRTVDPVAP
jgi:Protein of unknown function (DUF1559)